MSGLAQWTPFLFLIGLIKHQRSVRVPSRFLSMGSADHEPMVSIFTQTDLITLGATRAIGDLEDGLIIRAAFEYLVNLEFKSGSGENSDPRQPTSGRYRFTPVPA